jgi:hypothetical protein
VEVRILALHQEAPREVLPYSHAEEGRRNLVEDTLVVRRSAGGRAILKVAEAEWLVDVLLEQLLAEGHILLVHWALQELHHQLRSSWPVVRLGYPQVAGLGIDVRARVEWLV